MGFLGFGKKRMSKKEFAVGILMVEPNWTKSWMEFFNDNFGTNGIEGIKLESHILSLYTITRAIPNHEILDVIFDHIYDSINGNNQLMEHISSQFEKYNKSLKNPIVLPQSIIGSINEHLETPIMLGMDQAMEISTRFSNQIKATSGMVEETMKKFKVEGLSA